jgi:hypothetical protein
MEELILIVQDLPVEVLLDEAENVLEQGVEGRLVGADGRDRELRPLQEILIADLRRGDLELVPDSALEALHDHPLLFEAPAAGEVEIEDGVGEDHEKAVSRQLSAVSFKRRT